MYAPARVAGCLKELTSEAASSGESALQGHKQFAEQLWDQTAAILERVALGLESTEQLTDFIKGRKKAEEESAKQLRMTCIVSVAPLRTRAAPCARLANCASDTVLAHGRADYRRTDCRRQAREYGAQQAGCKPAARSLRVSALHFRRPPTPRCSRVEPVCR